MVLNLFEFSGKYQNNLQIFPNKSKIIPDILCNMHIKSKIFRIKHRKEKSILIFALQYVY